VQPHEQVQIEAAQLSAAEAGALAHLATARPRQLCGLCIRTIDNMHF
jgi:hypothetical protein